MYRCHESVVRPTFYYKTTLHTINIAKKCLLVPSHLPFHLSPTHGKEMFARPPSAPTPLAGGFTSTTLHAVLGRWRVSLLPTPSRPPPASLPPFLSSLFHAHLSSTTAFSAVPCPEIKGRDELDRSLAPRSQRLRHPPGPGGSSTIVHLYHDLVASLRTWSSPLTWSIHYVVNPYPTRVT